MRTKFLAMLFVAIFLLTAAQAQMNSASKSKNAVTVERMIYHVLLDGPKDFVEYGWAVRFTKMIESSPDRDDVPWIEYLVTAIKEGTQPKRYVVREVWGVNTRDHLYEHAISVKVSATKE